METLLNVDLLNLNITIQDLVNLHYRFGYNTLSGQEFDVGKMTSEWNPKEGVNLVIYFMKHAWNAIEAFGFYNLVVWWVCKRKAT